MSVQDIIEKIQEKGEEELKKIRGHYEARVQEITKKQEEERKSFYDVELGKIEKEKEEVKRGILLSAKLEQRKKILKAKRGAIDGVFEKAKADFQELVGKDAYYVFLKSVVAGNAQDGDTVYLSAADMKDFQSMLQKDVSAKVSFQEAGQISGGAIIERSSFNYNFSIDALLEQKREELEKDIGAKLNVL